MYSKEFAKVYNTEWASFSELLADKIAMITDGKKKLLDLGCGTGNFIKKLEDKFDRIVGIDLSKHMIEVAKKKCKKAEFFVKSVTNFNLDEKFDLITCNFDMINHLQSIEDWAKMFKLAYLHLEENGIFTFDYNTIYKMRILDYSENAITNDNYNITALNTKLDENHVRMQFWISNKENNKIADVDEIESFYTEKQVIGALKIAGFNNIKLCDGEYQELKNFDVKRIFVICEK